MKAKTGALGKGRREGGAWLRGGEKDPGDSRSEVPRGTLSTNTGKSTEPAKHTVGWILHQRQISPPMSGLTPR